MVDKLTMSEANAVPASEEDVIHSFNLTPEEQVEVEALQRTLSRAVPEEDDHLEDLARISSNAGEQYLLSKRHNLVSFLVKNRELDPRVVPLLLAILADDEAQVPSAILTDDEVQVIVALNFLLIHKAVVGDVKLFEQTWKLNQASRASSTPPADRAFYESMIISDALYYHPTATSGHVNSMSIATLLFIQNYLNNSEYQDLVFILKQTCDESVEARRDEIREWVSEYMPDYVDLPLLWALQVYDLHND